MNTAAIPMPMYWPMRLLERNLLPDCVVRFGIRRLLHARLAAEHQGSPEAQQRHLMKFIARLRQSPLAINTAEANLQHYELPCAFFELVLGRHLKYSSGYYRAITSIPPNLWIKRKRICCG
jgi:cyclopropane-fatty-acyl-phospholipid synthase